MYISSRQQKITSYLLILSIFFSLSPVLSTKVNAAGPGSVANSAQATPIAASGAGINAACTPLVLGNGIPCDPGVRFNTYQILLSTIGIGPGVAQRETYWNSIFYFAMRILLREVTMSIVNWINSGFQGNPSFIQDPIGFLQKDADRVIGNFIQNSDLDFLCEPFKINIKLALGLQYSPFQDQIGCRLTDILKNSDDAYNNFVNGDFIGGGGWESWLSVTTVPQNNQMGAMLIAQSQLDAQINDQSVLKGNELNWSGGLLSMKDCTKTYKDAAGNVVTSEKYIGDPAYRLGLNNSFSNPIGSVSNTSQARYNDSGMYRGSVQEECKVVTPGVAITEQMKKSTSLDLDALNMADDLNEIVGALANFVITKAINKGYALIDKNELSPNDASWRNGIAQTQAQIGNDIRGISSSNPSYEPQPSQYTSDNGGITFDGNNPDTNGLASDKTNLVNTINAYRTNEQNYFNANFAVYTAASTTINKLTSVIACYNTKLSASGLSNAKTTEGNNAISAAQATTTQMANIINTIVPGLNTSQNNLAALQTISTQAAAANTADSLTNAYNNLSSLTQSLHSASEANTASTTAASTLAQIIIPSLQAADTASSSCAVFPN